jgi:hypothetical protein
MSRRPKLEALVGLLAIVISAVAMWWLSPRNGEPHPWVTKPYLDSAIPLALMTGFIFGITAIVKIVGPMLLGAD